MKVLIMGFGLHGGGLETAKYLLKHGADLTISDLRDEKTLTPSINELETACKGLGICPSIRYVLGRHDYKDFSDADMVIKNPAVKPDSPYLKSARRIETDISLFLSAIDKMNLNIRLTAVTGSKGKSSTASAIHFALSQLKENQNTYLGGNITKSPLSFLDKLSVGDDVVLELSSWQLGDLKGRCIIKPKIAVMTPIFPDHLDHYGTMEAYINDKKIIYQGQSTDDFIIAKDDSWGNIFISESKAAGLFYSDAMLPEGIFGAWLEGDGPGLARLQDGTVAELVPAKPLVIGPHQKQNLLAAGLVLISMGFPPDAIKEALGSFPGIPHRMELFHKSGSLSFYNDSAATIPEAAAASIAALAAHYGSVILVTGGTDKNLDFTPLFIAAAKAKKIILLDGTGSEKLAAMFTNAGIGFLGPCKQIESAAKTAIEAASPNDCIVLSPGCASFGMFLNEFDRGNKWKEAILKMESHGSGII